MFKGKPVEKQGHKVTGLSGPRIDILRHNRMIAGLPKLTITEIGPLSQSNAEGLLKLFFSALAKSPLPLDNANTSSWRLNATEHK
jgi:hypothetical protein